MGSDSRKQNNKMICMQAPVWKPGVRREKFCSTKNAAPLEPSGRRGSSLPPTTLTLDLTFPGQILPMPKGQIYPAF